MKHNARQSGKFIKLVRRLRVSCPNLPVDHETVAVGILERLWHLTMASSPRGDIGKLDDDTIAEGVGWHGDASEIIGILVETKWLDPDEEHRLLIHNWSEHAPSHIKRNIARRGGFIEPKSAQNFDAVIETPVSKMSKNDANLNASSDVAITQVSTEADTKRLSESSSGDLRDQKDLHASTPNLTKPNLTKPNHRNTHTQTGFKQFWESVHAKIGKGAASKAYERAVKRLKMAGREDPEGFLLERMRAFAASPNAKPPDRSPIHPATWLNQERYDDDPAEWQRVSRGRRGFDAGEEPLLL